jgi:hypothetical protein
VDTEKLGKTREAWPKTVRLRKAVAFPAVVSGKAVGQVEAPAGSEANLVKIENGKLGVEYFGGGAWVAVDDTDLAQRLSH